MIWLLLLANVLLGVLIFMVYAGVEHLIKEHEDTRQLMHDIDKLNNLPRRSPR